MLILQNWTGESWSRELRVWPPPGYMFVHFQAGAEPESFGEGTRCATPRFSLNTILTTPGKVRVVVKGWLEKNCSWKINQGPQSWTTVSPQTEFICVWDYVQLLLHMGCREHWKRLALRCVTKSEKSVILKKMQFGITNTQLQAVCFWPRFIASQPSIRHSNVKWAKTWLPVGITKLSINNEELWKPT